MSYLSVIVFFCVKQKTAYEMRISDWSSDVCSSDLSGNAAQQLDLQGAVDQIVAAIAAQHRPEVRLALTVFFSRLFWCILGAVMQVAVSAALASYVPPKDVSQSTQATAKQIKEAAQAVSTPELIAGLRYVNDTQLNVRINPHHQTQTHSEERPTGKK